MKFRFKWMTPDERVPRDYDDVLVTIANDESEPTERYVVQAYYVSGTFFDATFNYELFDVVAWCWQPEPYDGE